MRSTRTSGREDRQAQRRTTLERAEALTEALQGHRRRIQDELEVIFRRLQEEGQLETGDAGDWAVRGFDRELRSARADQLTKVLRQIDGALFRLEEGQYGRCIACDAEIPVGRLRSLPFALYCRDCQEAAEESRLGLVGPIA